ncbi:hypothetical protein E4656_08130 [Natronospirillum operosum]|uniref:Ppx/GppA phosphatase N-terminal domain-containing protein n=1 Tax=Natronospirillum operosum TaxID=2759953 RepID=A0A4Z0WHQ4_9GAMM|nr:hypothetical protein [Natronospirillum operosum]TGG94130.1 hypothetical protein E4656_08130 [Natronospirillum operosum]
MPADHYAAIDLGANSFHLVIMSPQGDNLASVDAHREIVRLSNGIHPETRRLRPETRRRALRCLSQFRQVLDRHQITGIRAVGTSAFRLLRHDAEFLQEAETTLGVPIDILTGEDEARLIYLGATWGLSQSERLVVDIGGGSTEIVLGSGQDIALAASLDMGSASLSSAFFSAHRISQRDLNQAREHVRTALRRHLHEPMTLGSQVSAVASSGTAKSLSWVLRSLHLSNGDITRQGLDRIEPVLWQVQNIDQLSHVLNLNIRRTHVFPGGYVIMSEVFAWLDIDVMSLSTRALREGIIVELMQSRPPEP